MIHNIFQNIQDDGVTSHLSVFLDLFYRGVEKEVSGTRSYE